jgi:ribosomal protein S12 methylthiotransferase
MKNRTVHIVSLGCAKNQVDAEVMAAILTARDYRITAEPQAAEVILVNTCAFILPAKEEAIDEILRMARYKKTGALQHLVVAGCLPQRYGKALEKDIPEVDLFLGISEVPNILAHIKNLTVRLPAGRRRLVCGKPDFLMTARHPRLLPPAAATTYLKIADGCSNRCTYCIIPTIRGKARSRHPDDILQEADGLAEKGVKEIILIAQDTTAYGRDLKMRQGLPLLLRKLAAIEKIRWIRLLYTHPAHLTEDVLSVMAAEAKICRYLDIPIQHIDDAVLKAMNRRISRKEIIKLIEKARALMPDVALRTSLITGFPGETDARFHRLVDWIREIRFDHLGVFTYSREEGTPAARLSSRISEKEKQRRRDLLMAEQALISFEINDSLIGSRQECIIEGKSDRPDYPFRGRCRRQAPEIDGMTYLRGENLSIGDILACTITDAAEYDLFGEII